MMATFKKTQPQDYQTDKLQSNIEEFFNNVAGGIFSNGRLIENITVNTTDTTINHLLDREPKGFIVVRLLNNSNVWETGRSKRFLILRASVQTTVNIWVF